MTEPINNINNILQDFKIKANCINYSKNNNYCYYDLKLYPRAKIKDIQKYLDEISLKLRTPTKPNLKLIPDQGLVRLEFASTISNNLKLLEYFTNQDIPKYDLPCLLGQSVSGNKIWLDLSSAPHLLVAGTTGSGKSVLLHNIIANLFNYSKAHLFLLDPKHIEFSSYKSLKNVHLAHTYEDSISKLDQLINLMETRYQYLRSGLDIKKLPYVVMIIDEFADLIMQDKDDYFYDKLLKLAQKCRAARINIILATQRPSVNIINGSIKANFPARISCRVASKVDSRVILDQNGAENLLGKGDALIKDNNYNLERFQIAYVSPKEICEIYEKI